MLALADIADQVHRVAPEFPVKSILLFGSYADGKPTEDSDIDLLVEFDSPSVSLLMIAALRERLETALSVSVDLIHVPLPVESFLRIGKVVDLYGA